MQKKNVALSTYSSFRMGGHGVLYLLETKEDIKFFFRENTECLFLGGGTNVLISEKKWEIPFVSYIHSNMLYEKVNEEEFLVRVSAGKEWDSFVEETVSLGFGTLAPLSLIPGKVGASPVQNIGAYGAEVKESIDTILCYDIKRKEWIMFTHDECEFEYRKSIFQTRKELFIVEITFRIRKGIKDIIEKPLYGAFASSFFEKEITPHSLREEVIRIRDSKLPRIESLPSVGSFFKNPLVSKKKGEELLLQYPSIPIFPFDDQQVKVAAGWLIEKADCAQIVDEIYFLYPNNKLVLSHLGQATLTTLFVYASKIQDRVREVFDISLEREPEVFM